MKHASTSADAAPAGKLHHDQAPKPTWTEQIEVKSEELVGQVKRLASRVVYLEQGRVAADLPTPDFFHPQRLQQVSAAAHLFVKGELV